MAKPNNTTTESHQCWRCFFKPRVLFRVARDAFAVVGVVLVLYHTCFHMSRVVSESMAPTLWGTDHVSGDLVLTEKVSYHFRTPKRWEIVTFPGPGGVLMKRVVGLPGETVSLNSDRELMIDGKVLPRPRDLADIKYYPYGNLRRGSEFVCEGGYYVLGDDSRDSDDSRFNGVIPAELIIGRSWAVLAPQEHRRWVTPQ
ncbi:signal peptidase I [Aeoliella sp.]|uniref:signal peptidase I n=1 Tax=Aeoliella sp. TaxID=2795800 RepID=UPI003CCBD59C